MKKEVEAYRTTIELEDIFDGKNNVDEVIEALLKTYNELLDYTSNIMGVRVVRYNFETNYPGHGGSLEVLLVFYRMETDEEYDERLRFEQKNKYTLEKKRLAKEKKERAEYERLKKKFGEV